MDTRFLASLVAVLEEGSMAAAARREGLTASAVTQRVAALEADVGTRLLRRAGRVMQPTEDCRRLLPRMREILRSEAAMRDTLRDHGLGGRLRLGAVSTAMGDYAGQVLRYLRRAAPDVVLELVPGTSKTLYAAMEQDQIDAAILVEPPFPLPKAFVFHDVEQQVLGVLRPKDRITPDLPYLVYSRDAWGGALCWDVLTSQVPTPEILAEMDALELIAQMVSEGAAQAVLPQWAGLSHFGDTQFLPSTGGYTRRMGLLLHQRDAEGALTTLLRKALQKA